jgi:hypothetical protein
MGRHSLALAGSRCPYATALDGAVILDWGDRDKSRSCASNHGGKSWTAISLVVFRYFPLTLQAADLVRLFLCDLSFRCLSLHHTR